MGQVGSLAMMERSEIRKLESIRERLVLSVRYLNSVLSTSKDQTYSVVNYHLQSSLSEVEEWIAFHGQERTGEKESDTLGSRNQPDSGGKGHG